MSTLLLSRCHCANADSCAAERKKGKYLPLVRSLENARQPHLRLILPRQRLQYPLELLKLSLKLGQHVLDRPFDQDSADKAETLSVGRGLVRFLEGFDDEAVVESVWDGQKVGKSGKRRRETDECSSASRSSSVIFCRQLE